MRRFYVSVLFVVASVVAIAQNPDSGKVRTFDLTAIRAIGENDSLYGALSERFEKGDSTLTSDDMEALYYGRAFRPDYTGDYSETDSSDVLLREQLYKELAEWCDRFLAKNPVSLRARYCMIVACRALGREREIGEHVSKYRKLLSVIVNSGSGTSQAPFRVLCVPDEQELAANYLQMTELDGRRLAQVEDRVCDVVTFRDGGPDRMEKREIWFDVTLPFAALGRSMREAR